jgi:hypothetical protein
MNLVSFLYRAQRNNECFLRSGDEAKAFLIICASSAFSYRFTLLGAKAISSKLKQKRASLLPYALNQSNFPLSIFSSLFDKPQLLPSFANDIHGAFDLAGVMRGSDGGTQSCQSFRHGR